MASEDEHCSGLRGITRVYEPRLALTEPHEHTTAVNCMIAVEGILIIASLLHGRLLEYPIFPDIWEIACMCRQCVQGIPPPPPRSTWV